MYIYLNDGLVPEEEARVSVFDHAFLYGDGVFETMRVYEGVPFMLDDHIERLHRSASLTGLRVPKDVWAIKASLKETLEANSFLEASLRVTVSRGSGPLGLDPALCKEPTFVIIPVQFKKYPPSFYSEGVGLIIPRTRRNLKAALDPRIKSLNFLNNILAKAEAVKAGAHEALMLNHEGILTECTVSNVFFISDGVLLTPSVECGILEGITRNVAIGLARREGIEVKEGPFVREKIYSADEVFITNSTMEVMPVGTVDGHRFEVGEVTRKLMEAYKQAVKEYIRNFKF
jgi:branched-chain amino acid aminotransferase